MVVPVVQSDSRGPRHPSPLGVAEPRDATVIEGAPGTAYGCSASARRELREEWRDATWVPDLHGLVPMTSEPPASGDVVSHVTHRFRQDLPRIITGSVLTGSLVFKVSLGREGAGPGLALLGSVIVVALLLVSRALFTALKTSDDPLTKLALFPFAASMALFGLALGLFFWPPGS